MSGSRIAVTLLAVVVSAACSGGGPTRGRPEGPARCEAAFEAPPGFRVVGSLEDPYPDRVGIRVGLASTDGREIHYFAGIPGEFGEGLPVAGSVEAATGIQAVLRGTGRTWVLSWETPGPCGRRAVLGNGFGRRGFLGTLREAGVIPGA